MNISADFLGMLERALQERYDAGFEKGRLEASVSADGAWSAGFAQAMMEVVSRARAYTTGEHKLSCETSTPGPVSEPEPELEPVSQAPQLSPAKAKIVGYVGGNPGVTAAEIQRACGGSNSAIYDLAKLGLVVKEGRQFYPVAVA